MLAFVFQDVVMNTIIVVGETLGMNKQELKSHQLALLFVTY